MINAVMHLVAWCLVGVLVWASWFREPVPERREFGALAELAQGYYLVGERGPLGGPGTGFGLLRYGEQGFGYRALPVDDWDGLLQGRLLALCPVRNYPGEVLVLMQLPEGGQARLVHLQVRRWDKSPKTALLGSALVGQAGPWQAMACGEASEQAMAVELMGGSASVRGHFGFADFSWQAEPADLPQADASYRDEAGLWQARVSGLATEIWLQPGQGDNRLMYRLDGFRVTGLAAGPAGYALSVVTAEPGLGGVWRPLGALSGQ